MNYCTYALTLPEGVDPLGVVTLESWNASTKSHDESVESSLKEMAREMPARGERGFEAEISLVS